MWRRERRRLANELVAECEAFVAGRYVERLLARGEPVPVWAWTNLLAHGTEADLRAAAAGLRGSPVASEWTETRAQLAAAMLGAVSPRWPLERLQAEVLAPLELRLASQAAVARWDRRAWSATVRAALAEPRPSRRP